MVALKTCPKLLKTPESIRAIFRFKLTQTSTHLYTHIHIHIYGTCEIAFILL